MLNQLNETMIENFVKKLNDKGISIDKGTVQKAIENFPQIAEKVQEILSSSSPEKTEKLTKIVTLLRQAAKGELTQSTFEKETSE